MVKRIIRRLPTLFLFYVLLTGIGFLAYPTISDWLLKYTAKTEIVNYKEAVKQQEKETIHAMMEEAVRYNERLGGLRSGETSIADYNDLLALTDAIGYLEIPKLGVYLPVYHGIDDEILQRGIGHLPETSLPVGGPSSHCVLSGHSGLPAARLLTDLDQMAKGDIFYIHVLDEVLAYEVDQIKTVLPNETGDIRIFPDEDYLTLLTCTPYGVNTHRLLVRGARVPYVPGQLTVEMPEKNRISPETLYLILECAAAGLLLLLTLLILLMPPRGKKKAKEQI